MFSTEANDHFIECILKRVKRILSIVNHVSVGFVSFETVSIISIRWNVLNVPCIYHFPFARIFKFYRVFGIVRVRLLVGSLAGPMIPDFMFFQSRLSFTNKLTVATLERFVNVFGTLRFILTRLAKFGTCTVIGFFTINIERP